MNELNAETKLAKFRLLIAEHDQAGLGPVSTNEVLGMLAKAERPDPIPIGRVLIGCASGYEYIVIASLKDRTVLIDVEGEITELGNRSLYRVADDQTLPAWFQGFEVSDV